MIFKGSDFVRKCFWLVILCICCIGLCLSVSAVDSAALRGTTAYAKPGGTVDFSVEIENNPGIASYLISIECDTTVFSVDSDESGNYEIEHGTAAPSGTLICNASGSRGWKIIWLSAEDETGDGTLFHLDLHISSAAANGEYPIRITYSSKNTANASGQQQEFEAIDGEIHVTDAAIFSYSGDAELVPGHSGRISVDLLANPGMAAFLLYLDCNPAVFQIDTAAICAGTAFSNGSLFCSKNGELGYQVLWYQEKNSIQTGTLFQIPMVISTDAPPGEYQIGLRVSENNTVDENGQFVRAELTAGSIALRQLKLSAPKAYYDEAAQEFCFEPGEGQIQPGRPILLIGALYDENGKMLDVQVMEICGDEELERTKIRIQRQYTYTTKMKVFILNNSIDCIPVENVFIVGVH